MTMASPVALQRVLLEFFIHHVPHQLNLERDRGQGAVAKRLAHKRAYGRTGRGGACSPVSLRRCTVTCKEKSSPSAFK